MNRLMKTKWKQLGILALCTVLLFTSACDRTGQNSEAANQGSSGDQDRAQVLADGKYEITLYTSCCNADKGIYYYTTYDNHQITAVDMHKENLDSNVLIRYPLIKEEQIRTQN